MLIPGSLFLLYRKMKNDLEFMGSAKEITYNQLVQNYLEPGKIRSLVILVPPTSTNQNQTMTDVYVVGGSESGE
jgi:hypothetical protein